MECVLICNPRVLFSLGCVVSRIVKGPCLVDDYMTDGISLHIKSNITTNKNTDATLLRNTCLLVKSSSIMYDLDGAALSGCLLASLLNEAVSPYAGPEQRTVRISIYIVLKMRVGLTKKASLRTHNDVCALSGTEVMICISPHRHWTV